jgi:poly(3-hydroxybutyrate) depolymerase
MLFIANQSAGILVESHSHGWRQLKSVSFSNTCQIVEIVSEKKSSFWLKGRKLFAPGKMSSYDFQQGNLSLGKPYRMRLPQFIMQAGSFMSHRFLTLITSTLLAIVVVRIPAGLSLATASLAADEYYKVEYEASTKPDELQMGVTYTLWLPPGVKQIRGIIVHQHGCGTGACQGGETAAYDLHWQALAAKWDCALLGPSYHQAEEQSCRLWCDPRNGSQHTFLRSISDFATQTGHAELKEVSWCLWGHSGGAFWASLMQTLYPERIAALWFRSGGAITAWEKEEIPVPEIPDAAYSIPAMCNPGVKEKDDARFSGAWVNAMKLFELYRAKGAPIGFAPDPRTAHECGDSRYLAIPFFDACLAMRLPEAESNSQQLKPIDMKSAWLAPLLGEEAMQAEEYDGKEVEASWLPNETFAKAWAEYVKTGAVSDTTNPPPPTEILAEFDPEKKTITLTWQAKSDFESGIQAFVIERDGQPLRQVPEKPAGQFGRPLFQSMSYHDTPRAPLPEMTFVDAAPEAGKQHAYRVNSINSVGRKSEPSEAAKYKN